MTPLYKPFMPSNLPELDSILHSGALAYSKWGKLFEKELQKFIGCSEDVIAVNSYTAALQVMLSAAGIELGDEIIASPQSCLASTMPLASYGAKIVWADIDPNRGTLDPDSVTSKITGRTKMILHNHHCGYPGYIDEINEIGRIHGLLVVDDCIEAFGARYKGEFLGNLGTDITTISFQTVRLPNTIDGGAIIFRDKEMACRAKHIRDLGVDRSTFRDARGEINPFSDVSMKGYGVTLNEICSYIGYTQIKELENLLKQQKQNGTIWHQKLVNSKYKLLDTIDIEPSYWVFGLLAKDKAKAIEEFRNQGWYASGVHVPNTLYSVFCDSENLPGVSEFSNKFLAIPSGWWVNSNKI